MWGSESVMELWIYPIWLYYTDRLAFWSQRCVCLSAFCCFGKSLFSLVCRRNEPDNNFPFAFQCLRNFQKESTSIVANQRASMPLSPKIQGTYGFSLLLLMTNSNEVSRNLRHHRFFIKLINNYF